MASKRQTLIAALLIFGIGVAGYFLAPAAMAAPVTIRHLQVATPTPPLQLLWNVSNSGPAAQTHPDISYDSLRDQTLLVWEDGRNDPRGVVDAYGFDYNDDIFARRYTAMGIPVGDAFAVASDGEYPPGSSRYDNEQRPATLYDPATDTHIITWQTIPDPVLEAGDLHTTTCYDVDLRTFAPATDTLTNSIADLAWYTPPDDLISPWGVFYDWSCQQEPAITLLGPDKPLVVWHDHRERYELVDGVMEGKDIYGQIVDHGVRQEKNAILISRAEKNVIKRLPNYQEKPDIAGQESHWLAVWEDERHSVTSDSHGFREIYGRVIYDENGVMRFGDEIAIALGQEGEGPEATKMMEPRVGFLPDAGIFLVVWTRVRNYAAQENPNTDLMMAGYTPDGRLALSPRVIPQTDSDRLHAHDIACAANRCLLVYRMGSNAMFARLLLDNGDISDPLALDDDTGYHSYARVVSGKETGDTVDFYAGYVIRTGIRLAKVRTTAHRDGHLTPTPTVIPTPTATPTPPCADLYEPDDNWRSASGIYIREGIQEHSFHQKNDRDFVRLDVRKGTRLIISTTGLASHVDTTLLLYGRDGVTQLAYNDDDPAAAPASRLIWIAPETGSYYLQITNFDTDNPGCDATYSLVISSDTPLYLPVIQQNSP